MAEKENENQENAGEEEGASQKQHKKSILWFLPLFLAVALIGAVYFANNFFNASEEEKPHADQKETAEQEPEKTGLIFFDVPEMLVNLNVKAGQKPVYFKVKIALEIEKVSDAEQIEKLLPRVIDSLQFYLREMRLDEVQGSMGSYRLKEEITARLNKILSPVKINDVLFKEVLIQ